RSRQASSVRAPRNGAAGREAELPGGRVLHHDRFVPVAGVPDGDHPGPVSACEILPVRAPGQGVDTAAAGEPALGAAGGCAPNLYLAGGRGSEIASVGTPRDSACPPVAARVLRPHAGATRVPQPESILVLDGDPSPVGAERRRARVLA